jgi:hypothetical protein
MGTVKITTKIPPTTNPAMKRRSKLRYSHIVNQNLQQQDFSTLTNSLGVAKKFLGTFDPDLTQIHQTHIASFIPKNIFMNGKKISTAKKKNILLQRLLTLRISHEKLPESR